MGLDLRLELNGAPLALLPPPAPGQGLRLADEPGAPPRRTTVELRPRDATAELSLRLAGGVLPLAATVRDGALRVESVPAGRLRGGFWLRLRVDDLQIAGGRWSRVVLDDTGQGRATLAARPRALEVLPAERLDPLVRAVLDGPSRVDGLPPEQWLREPLRQPKRRACLLNLLAVLRAIDLFGRPAVTTLQELLHVATDHLQARASAELYWLVSEAARLPDSPARQRVFDDFGIHSSHKRALERLARELGLPAPASFESFRFEGRPSLQIVFAIPPGAADSHLVDLDLDLGNPRQDLLGLVVHFGELFDEGLDHVALRRKLARGPAGPYLGYS